MKKTFVIFIMFLLFSLLSFVEVSASEKEKFNDFITSNREFRQTGEGVYTDKYYFKCVNYFENGVYKEINNKFVKTKDGFKNCDSNYQIELPQRLFSNKTINLDYYGKRVLIGINNLELSYEGNINNSHSENDRVFSDSVIYESSKYNIMLKNFTDSLKIYLSAESYSVLSSFQMNIELENLSFALGESSIAMVDSHNISLFELDTNVILTSENEIYEGNVIIENGNVSIEVENYPIIKKYAETSIVLEIDYTINTYTDCILDKHVVKGIDYSYDQEYMNVGETSLGIYNGIISIDPSILNTSMNLYEANLVYFKEAGPNIPLSIYEVDENMYSDITGLSVYDKQLLSLSNYNNNKYQFDITTSLEHDPITDTGKYIFEISSTYEGSGLVYLCSESSGDVPYLELKYMDVEYSLYGSALDYETISSPEMNCFGYALNRYSFLQITNNGEWIEEFSGGNLTEQEYQTIIIPATLAAILDEGIEARIITAYDSQITNDEYRIALRCGNLAENEPIYLSPYVSATGRATDSFHFLRQDSDGKWSHKYGELVSQKLSFVTNPALYSWPTFYPVSQNGGVEQYNNFYDSSICYIAIKTQEEE